MQKVKVYDLPTRAFHLLFGVLFIVSFFIGKFIDDDSLLYSYHMLSGLLMAAIVVLRIIWGIVGSKYARFSSFKLNPKDLLVYFRHVLAGKTKRELGHNPASSYASILMFIFTFCLVGTGLLMINGFGKEFFEEIHEIFAFIFLITVIFHIMGVIFHSLKHQDGMILSMFNGKKEAIEGQRENDRNSPIVFGLFLLLVLVLGNTLLSNFESQTRTLSILGKQLHLGESQNKHKASEYNKYYNLDDARD